MAHCGVARRGALDKSHREIPNLQSVEESTPVKIPISALLGIIISLFTLGCGRAVSNVQTIISDDCGQNWKLVPVGEVIPSRVGYCALKVTIPNYPMAGESNFIGTFGNNVRVNVNSSYDYTIIEPLKFIQAARFIGRQNSDGDDPANGATMWDTAEGIVIDRNLRELANSEEFLRSQNIVDFSQGEFEDKLLIKLNEALKQRGVQLNTFTFVVTPDNQTRNMIDVSAALRVCESIKSLSSGTCQEIIKARAGATNVSISTLTPADKADSK